MMNERNYVEKTTELEKFSLKKAAEKILDFLNTPNGIYDQVMPKEVARNQSWLNYLLVDKKILIQGTPAEYMDCLNKLASYRRMAV